MFEIIPVPAFRDNYIWCIKRPGQPEVAFVDPGEAGPVIEVVEREGWRPVAILITHHHHDHVGGAAELRDRYDIPVHASADEKVAARTHPVRPGDRVRIEALAAEFEAIGVPGHTAHPIAYYGHGSLFSGDTLFAAGCGRLFEGTAEQMQNSLARLRDLPSDTALYCGHEYTVANLSFALAVEPDNEAIRARLADAEALRNQNAPTLPATLAIEKQTNPFLRWDTSSVRRAASDHAGRELGSDVEVFAEVRRWKDHF